MADYKGPFVAGSNARLRSGGPTLTVESCEWRSAQEQWFVLCWWMTEAGELRSGHIPQSVLIVQ